MYHTHEMIYIMDLKHYENGAGWTGSWKGMRYKTTPIKDDEKKEIKVEIWRTPLCYELSEIEETTSFPMTEDGVLQAEAWLENKSKEKNEEGK